MDARLQHLYFGNCCTAELEKKNKSVFDSVRAAFNKASEYIHKLKGFSAKNLKDEPIAELVNSTAAILVNAVNPAIAYKMPEVMRKALIEDVFLFSGAKTYVQLKQISEQLLDSEGNIKPLQTFKRDIESIDASYNQRYLATERNYAIGTAQNAAKWVQFEAEKERYDLKYVTDNGPNVRESHDALNGTVLPVDEWGPYAPKNGWNCHCDLLQVKKGRFPVSDLAETRKKGEAATTVLDKDGNNTAAIFRFNPGAQKVIFPPKHPYYKITPEGAKATLKELSILGRKDWEKDFKRSIYQLPVEKQYSTVFENEKGGKVMQHVLADNTASDFEDVFDIAVDFAEKGKIAQMLPIIHEAETEARSKIFPNYDRKAKSPDLRIDKEYWEVEKSKGSSMRNVRSRVNSGLAQAEKVALILEDKKYLNAAKEYLKKAKSFVIK